MVVANLMRCDYVGASFYQKNGTRQVESMQEI